MRDSTIFYRSFWEAIKTLPATEQVNVYNAIFELALNGTEVEIAGIGAGLMLLIKPNIEANNKKYNNGIKPKKQNRSKTEAIYKQNGSKHEGNEDVDEDVDENKKKALVFNFKTIWGYKVVNPPKFKSELECYQWMYENCRKFRFDYETAQSHTVVTREQKLSTHKNFYDHETFEFKDALPAPYPPKIEGIDND